MKVFYWCAIRAVQSQLHVILVVADALIIHAVCNCNEKKIYNLLYVSNKAFQTKNGYASRICAIYLVYGCSSNIILDKLIILKPS